jgi:TRAP-type uncharacterized transport system substrate-binding protein
MSEPPELLPPAIRAKVLAEIAVGIVAQGKFGPATRDVMFSVVQRSGQSVEPRLRMATGNAGLAYEVADGAIDIGFINPSGLLTQAYLGKGLFSEALPLRMVACYPSWDRMVYLVHPRTGITSLSQMKERRQPLRLSIRRDPAHATVVLVEQTLARYGFSLADLQSWGSTLQYVAAPRDAERMASLRAGNIDAVFDEGIGSWLDDGLGAGLKPVSLEEGVLAHLESLGWRRATVPASRFRLLEMDYIGIDFSGWALYTRAAMSAEAVYQVCDALHARANEIPWEAGAYTDFGQLGRDTPATPIGVPLHPGAARWFSEHSSP